MHSHVKTDREELHAMFEETKVEVTPEEFENVYTIQKQMRDEHDRLGKLMDKGELSSEGFLDASESNFSGFMKLVKAILGVERYQQLFGTDQTENIFPVDREAFRAIQGANTTES
ncbi:MAG: hypothetical protein EOP83_16020 [Verrucomicrobiaceae bacterium]|nr:MAG: hypothetical protein EOP83_16020 [Verrucomicrobiaceae bacterium]